MAAPNTLIAAAVATLLLGGCTLAPDYLRPAAPVPAAWPASAGSTQAGADTRAADIPWQDFFTDPALQRVIEQALQNNRDLRVAALNIEKARAQYQIQRADLFPAIDASAGGSVKRLPADLASDGKAGITRSYSVGLGFTAYELDLFGRVRSLKDEALQTFLATTESRRSTHISLIAEVANAWLTLAADRQRLQLARDTLISQQASYGLNKRRFDAGVGSELTLRQSQSQVDSARADVASYTAQVARDENALAVLVGKPLAADDLPRGLDDTAPTVSELPAGLPSSVLLERPDVLSAEHSLQAANADIGAARAAFFPSITLTASGGTTSSQLDGLFKGGSGTWSFVPQITLPIFNAGRNQAQLDVSKANREIAQANYEKAIQVAFQEVANALATRANVGEELDARRSLVEATQVTYKLSEARFEQGVDSYLDVLDAQRSLYTAQQGLITTQQSAFASQVNLYKALGGGWKSAGEDKAQGS